MYVRKNGRYLSERDTDLSNYQITIEKSGNNVIAKAERKSSGIGNLWNMNDESISFTVYVPSSYSTQLGTSGGRISLSNLVGSQRARTSGGSLSFENLSGSVNGRTSGGSISASKIDGTFDVATSGGSIRVDDVTGEATMKTSGGSINIKNGRGQFDASTSGGSITANFLQVTGSLTLGTSGGSINVRLPRNLSFHLDARANRVNANDLSFSGRSEHNRMLGNVNGGGIPVRLRTSSGSVTITTD